MPNQLPTKKDFKGPHTYFRYFLEDIPAALKTSIQNISKILEYLLENNFLK